MCDKITDEMTDRASFYIYLPLTAVTGVNQKWESPPAMTTQHFVD